jgi:altronate dehydratase small subunit
VSGSKYIQINLEKKVIQVKKNISVLMDKKDNVATALIDLYKGESIEINGHEEVLNLLLNEDIPSYHKFALKDFKIGDKIYKYGQVIGEAICKIQRGEHVHIHNIKSLRGGLNEI